MGVFGKSEEVFCKVLLKLGFLREGVFPCNGLDFPWGGVSYPSIFFKGVNRELFKRDGGGGGRAAILYNMEKPNQLSKLR